MTEVILFAVLALMAFYYFNWRIKTKREDRRDRLREKREEYMNNLLEKLRSEKGQDKPSEPDQRTQNNSDS